MGLQACRLKGDTTHASLTSAKTSVNVPPRSIENLIPRSCMSDPAQKDCGGLQEQMWYLRRDVGEEALAPAGTKVVFSCT